MAASGYAIGLLVAKLWKKDHETSISMMYGNGMRNISVGAVIAAAYFPGEVMFPVMIGTLFQQVLAAFYGKQRSSRVTAVKTKISLRISLELFSLQGCVFYL